MTDFKIDKKRAVPAKRNGPKYPFLQMKKGESFLVPMKNSTRRDQQNLCSAAGQHTTRHGTRFSVRKVDGGFRIWRIS